MFARWLYTLCFTFLLPVIVLRLLWRSFKAPDYRRRWAERLGVFSVTASQHWKQPPIWIHAVSVGETLAAVPRVKALQKQYPDYPLIITTTTPTGSARVQATFAEAIKQKQVFHTYAPYDLPWAINGFLCRTKPRLLIIMETELWPNLLQACVSRNIPTLLANGRLSEKSARGYQRLAPLTHDMLKNISCIAAQNISDGDRFLKLGLDQNKLVVTGSIKFDLELSPQIQQSANDLRQIWSPSQKRLVWLAASTHPGEDEIVLAAFSQLKKSFPTLLLILVPRHPERFNEVYRLCIEKKYCVQRRSDHISNTELFNKENFDIVLGDTMGELLAFYGACDIAFVGGSLVPVGGHNLVEPAAWGKAIISGHHLHNFSEISSLLIQRQALSICHDGNELSACAHELLEQPEKRIAMGKQAQIVALENRGALQKLLALIDSILKNAAE